MLKHNDFGVIVDRLMKLFNVITIKFFFFLFFSSLSYSDQQAESACLKKFRSFEQQLICNTEDKRYFYTQDQDTNNPDERPAGHHLYCKFFGFDDGFIFGDNLDQKAEVDVAFSQVYWHKQNLYSYSFTINKVHDPRIKVKKLIEIKEAEGVEAANKHCMILNFSNGVDKGLTCSAVLRATGTLMIREKGGALEFSKLTKNEKHEAMSRVCQESELKKNPVFEIDFSRFELNETEVVP